MKTNSCFTPSNLMRSLTNMFICCVLGAGAIHAQEAAAPKTVLDFEGNKAFSKPELLEVANRCLTGFSKSQDEAALLDYAYIESGNPCQLRVTFRLS